MDRNPEKFILYRHTKCPFLSGFMILPQPTVPLRDDTPGSLLRRRRAGSIALRSTQCLASLARLTLLTWEADKPETNIDDPVEREGPAAVRRPAVLRGVVPRPAAQHPVRTRSWTNWIS